MGADTLTGFPCSVSIPFHDTWEFGALLSAGGDLCVCAPEGKASHLPMHSGQSGCLASVDSDKALLASLQHFKLNEYPGDLDHNL